MEQQKLEEKVRKTFEEQGFKVEKERDRFKASKEGEEKVLEVYSSEKYEESEVLEEGHEGIVFVDEGLSGLKEEMDVSIIYNEEKEAEYELPSYEIIGDIAVISELTVDEGEAVEGILDHHPHVKTILLKKGGLKGEFRVGDYEKLYGEETETVHREFGCEFKVDPTKAYFSERFSTERDRIVSQIEGCEKVLVMFAGVGPFAVMAAKNASPEKVVGVEKNPEACDYMKENVKLNDVDDTVEAFCGDVTEIDYTEKFDRIVMPLPGSADEFLALAMELTEDNGVIHYYRFLEEQNWEELESEIEQVSREKGLEYEILDRVKCGERGPTVDRVCIDIKVLR